MPPKSKTQKGKKTPQKNNKPKNNKQGKVKAGYADFKGYQSPLSMQNMVVTASVPKIVGAVTHRDEGVGIRVTGTEEIGTLNSLTASYASYADYSSGGSDFFLNPAYLQSSSRLYSLAWPWAKFRFNRVSFRFATQVATNFNVGNFVMSYNKDPVQLVTYSSTTHKKLMETPPAVSFAGWIPAGFLVDKKALGDAVYYIDVNSVGGDADFRQSYQGVLQFANSTLNATANTIVGLVYMDYDIELYGPRVPADVALAERRVDPSRSLTLKEKIEINRQERLHSRSIGDEGVVVDKPDAKKKDIPIAYTRK